jgi:serine/threonine protein phosphatase 1
MITRYIRKLRNLPDKGTPPHIPDGQRIYCIGDIHGSAGLLQQLHTKILADADGYDGNKTVVYLGDYVDKGEHSRQVIDILLGDPLPGAGS